MSKSESRYNLRTRNFAVVISIGLAQAAALVGLLLLTILLINDLETGMLVQGDQQALRQMFTRIGWMAAIAIVYGLLRGFEFAYTEKIGYGVVKDLRMQMYGHLQGMAPRQIQGRSRGGLLLRFVGDLSMLRMWISRGRLSGLTALIVLTITLSVMAYLNVWITVAFVSVTALGGAFSFASGDTIRRATRVMRRRRSTLTSNIDEQVNSLAVPQVFGRSSGEFARLGSQNDSLYTALVKVASLRGRLRGITLATSQLTVVAVLAVGTLEIYRGHATIGLVVAIVTITRQLSGPIRTLGLAHDYWQRSRVSVQKLDDFLSSSSRVLQDPTKEHLKVKAGVIEFRDISVPGALNSVSLRAERGQLVAITGPSGAGKSTLLGLVSRFVEPTSGQVVVDDQVLADQTLASTFRYFGLMSPDLPLMRGSVRRNVTYRHRDASDEEVQRVVLASGLDSVLDEIPNGLDTWVNEGGRNLSAGQRQRIALARALMSNPPILLLDEPSANLDPESREAFRHMLSRHLGTVLLVTHDPVEMALADQVWELSNGTVARTMSGDQYRDEQWALTQTRERWRADVNS